MWTKHHQAFCNTCGKTTHHVTHYMKDHDGGTLIADVQCAEHQDAPSKERTTPESAITTQDNPNGT